MRIQRQRKILYQRLKVPPSINQFSNTLDKNLSLNLFKLLHKYRPEDAASKKERIAAMAAAKEAGDDDAASKKPLYVKYGINHITKLCEDKKAQLVVIAHDVDPIELVVWLPAVCRKMDIPYCIVKNKSRLGQLVGKKTATCVAITGVDKADQGKLQSMMDLCKSSFNDNMEALKVWGGGKMGLKTVRRLAIRQKMLDAEAAKKAMY